MRALIIALNVVAGLGCLAMAGYGFTILLISQMDPLHPDDVGIALGCALSGTFLMVPAFSIMRSTRLLTRDRRRSLTFALAPFAFIAFGVVAIRIIPWPSPPQPAARIAHYPETPVTYFWRLSHWPL
jgi:hypothetical protein